MKQKLPFPLIGENFRYVTNFQRYWKCFFEDHLDPELENVNGVHKLSWIGATTSIPPGQ